MYSDPVSVMFEIALYVVLPSWSCDTDTRDTQKYERSSVTTPFEEMESILLYTWSAG